MLRKELGRGALLSGLFFTLCGNSGSIYSRVMPCTLLEIDVNKDPANLISVLFASQTVTGFISHGTRVQGSRHAPTFPVSGREQGFSNQVRRDCR